MSTHPGKVAEWKVCEICGEDYMSTFQTTQLSPGQSVCPPCQGDLVRSGETNLVECALCRDTGEGPGGTRCRCIRHATA